MEAEGARVGRTSFIASHAGDELRDEMDQAVRSMRKTPDFVEHTNRMFDVPLVRVKGLKPRIVKATARLYACRLKRPVPERMVHRCLAEYRQFLRLDPLLD